MGRLLILFIATPLVELFILLRIAGRIGPGPTIALVVATGAIGAWLARREGIKAFARIQRDLNAGTLPGTALVDAAMILVAGVLLITPGIITDIVGFSLLTPSARKWIRPRLAKMFKRRMVVIRRDPQEQTFVDVEATVVDDPQDSDDSAPTDRNLDA